MALFMGVFPRLGELTVHKESEGFRPRRMLAKQEFSLGKELFLFSSLAELGNKQFPGFCF